MIGLIPARSGSERIPNKNIRELAGYPLMAYSIASALGSGIIRDVIVSTDSPYYAKIARRYGAGVIMRPERYALGASPDIEWMLYTIRQLSLRNYDKIAILRPTSPFRSAKTIRRCYAIWDDELFESIRAVEPVSQHPGKMWVLRDRQLLPLISLQPENQPWHSSQMKSLPEVFVQNASLEMVRAGTVRETKSIAGTRIQGFLTEGWEGFDLNTEYDWKIAEAAIESGEATLPEIE